MNLRTLRQVTGFYVFLFVFIAAPAAQQKHVPAETTRLIELLKLGPESTVADVGAGADKPVAGPVPPAQRGWGDAHGVTSDTLVAELKSAGFEILEGLPTWPGGLFMVLARRP